MTRETVIQNLINNYREYGITREVIEPIIACGEAEGCTYDLIYLTIKAQLSAYTGEEFYCTSEDMAKAFDISADEINQTIEECREELLASGENPDDYFRQVQSTRFLM